MEKNRNEQERATYNRLILEKENSVDDLSHDQRKIEDSLHNLNEELHRGYRSLAMILEKDHQDGSSERYRMIQKNEDQEHFFKRQLQEIENQLLEGYHDQRKKIEKETEQLYKKRSEIPWD